MTSDNMRQNHTNIDSLIKYIKETAIKPLTIMEVCGTHTMSIYRQGIKDILPSDIHLVSGPGCPVCVTDSSTLAQAFALAETPNVIFTCFGDMIRVPLGDTSLRDMAHRCDIRIILSPLDALDIAIAHPEYQVIFFAVGFETTAPLTAATLIKAQKLGVKNFSVLCAHKTMPAAIRNLLVTGNIDALLCPGHVAVIMGAEQFSFIPHELGISAAISGFEAEDILLAIAHICKDVKEDTPRIHNCYPRVVTSNGNINAQKLMRKVFMPADAAWRGLGNIAKSGLALRPEYSAFDAEKRFQLEKIAVKEDERCCCGSILAGKMQPQCCPLFAKICTPEHPIGACMVSSEGSCAAAYKYGRGIADE